MGTPLTTHGDSTIMLTKLVALISLAAVCTASPAKRQLPTCSNAFVLTTNPCVSGQGRTYYPVPNDNTKFVQCDILGGAYVVQCPQGQVYNQALNSCQLPQPLVTPTKAPANPCTAAAISAGKLYYAVAGDKTKFYQCTGVGQLQIDSCPANLVWSQARVSCVLPQGTQLVNPTAVPVQQNLNNPCTSAQIANGNLYFAHPDPTKFIQCDLIGNAYEMLCPTNLVWNQYYEVCVSSFQTGGAILGKK